MKAIKMTECTVKNLNCGWCMGAGALVGAGAAVGVAIIVT
ncbi:hypothetical protein IGI58_001322 [Enterococcus sp. AZ020]|uniref:Uncharacterized protein n=1 Tax=Candidatus Enterococcus dunnyi TaxID=1834192 RepID=A0A200J0U7_9ENTE|nr:hypothetical protein A5889_002747 [Enterococcus sp. 9D6_DIV0238]